jgi:hypothetical protein
VQLARRYFRLGRENLNQVENLRCKLAGFAYTVRFEGVLDAIERDGYCLRAAYPERKELGAMVWAGASLFTSLFNRRGPQPVFEPAPARQRSSR